MTKRFVWLSFDLGVKGDYEGMYKWLDSLGAKQCGDSVACFWFEHRGDDLLNAALAAATTTLPSPRAKRFGLLEPIQARRQPGKPQALRQDLIRECAAATFE